jgi:hypothetical protein
MTELHRSHGFLEGPGILHFVTISALCAMDVGYHGLDHGRIPGTLCHGPAGSPVFTIFLCGIVISGIVLLSGGNLDWLASI